MQLQLVASRYRIKGKLGGGSMGNVYLAADIRLGRDVALKFLRSELVASQRARHRFETEARRLAGMSNPNLASIHDYGEEKGLPYMVLELIEGVDLERILKKRRMPVEVAASVILEALGGIEYAQSLGVVHRDIKPSNVMLTPDGHVKVIDFGIALDENWDQRKTAAGAILCTPAYASPEQAMGLNKQVDKRSDVYSLGAVFFEMLTGEPPLLRETVEETREAHFTESAPPLPADFGLDLVAVVARSLAKEKLDRYPSAGEFRIALKKALPPDSLDPDAVASYISHLREPPSVALRKSDDAISDAAATILEGREDDSYFLSNGTVEKTGSPMPHWAIYISVAVLSAGLVVGAIALKNIGQATQSNVSRLQDSTSANGFADQGPQQPASPAASPSQSSAAAASPSKTNKKADRPPQCDISTPEIDLALARAEIFEHAGRLFDAEVIYRYLMRCRAAREKASAGLKQIRLLEEARGKSTGP
jgi:serine/threonine protein kinase